MKPISGIHYSSHQAWLQFTRLGITAFSAYGAPYAWVSNLVTGGPIEDATVDWGMLWERPCDVNGLITCFQEHRHYAPRR